MVSRLVFALQESLQLVRTFLAIASYATHLPYVLVCYTLLYATCYCIWAKAV